MTRTLTAAVLAALAAAPLAASAQQLPKPGEQSVIARALGGIPRDYIVRYVARNAQPIEFDKTSDPAMFDATANEAIDYLCGSVQPGYLDELHKLNPGAAIDLNKPLADAAFSVQWPACLHVTVAAPSAPRYVVKPTDTLSQIREYFTGAGARDKDALEAYFAADGLKEADGPKLLPKEKLTIPVMTSTTSLVTKGAADDFITGLRKLAGATVEVHDNAKPAGTLIAPIDGASPARPPGAIKSAPAACAGGTDGYPFDPVQVNAAYKLATVGNRAPTPVSLVIVDNGFFGAYCGAGGCPEMDGKSVRLPPDRFPLRYFDSSRFKLAEGFGPLVSDVRPLNFRNRSPSTGKTFAQNEVNFTSGHGTHVAGLALGGPLFVPYRSIFEIDGRPWITLVIVNVANGGESVLPGFENNLGGLIRDSGTNKIVNMSIAFDARDNSTLANTVSYTIEFTPKSLYVAAAGNETADFNQPDMDFYPAVLGGLRDPDKNVITVASVDGTGKLSYFSNFGNRSVDIAAPGCGINSWIDGQSPVVALSGTSQAAPLVTFAAALVNSVAPGSPAFLANRLMYSGDLLPDPADRGKIASRTKLNIAKALLAMFDQVTYRDKSGQVRTVLGELTQVQGLTCADQGKAVGEKFVRAVKRTETGDLVIYSVDQQRALSVCTGAATVATHPSWWPRYEVVNGEFRPLVATDYVSEPFGQVDELILADHD